MVFKFGFVEEFVMYFSLPGERKVPKERHLRKVPTVLSLRILSPYLRASFALWRKRLRHYYVAVCHEAARSSE